MNPTEQKPDAPNEGEPLPTPEQLIKFAEPGDSPAMALKRWRDYNDTLEREKEYRQKVAEFKAKERVESDKIRWCRIPKTFPASLADILRSFMPDSRRAGSRHKDAKRRERVFKEFLFARMKGRHATDYVSKSKCDGESKVAWEKHLPTPTKKEANAEWRDWNKKQFSESDCRALTERFSPWYTREYLNPLRRKSGFCKKKA